MTEFKTGDYVKYAYPFEGDEEAIGIVVEGQSGDYPGEIRVEFPIPTVDGWSYDVGIDETWTLVLPSERVPKYIVVAADVIRRSTLRLEELESERADMVDCDTLNEALLAVAIVFDRTVTFTYAKGDGNVLEQRRMRPETITETADGHRIVAGVDADRDEPRSYRLDRIKGDVRL